MPQAQRHDELVHAADSFNRVVLLAGGCHGDRLFFIRFLASRGFRIAFAANSSQAQALLNSSNAPHVLIVDYELPGMSELCRRLRSGASAPYLYILAFTPKSHPMVHIRALECGADDTIAKPLNPIDLETKLKMGCRVVRLEEQLTLLRAELGRVSRCDELTTVLNRAAVLKQLDSDRARALREQTNLGLMLIDIDHFKQVNDTFGHVAGDKVLVAVATRLRSETRPYDSVGRYGGDEFIVIMPGSGRKELEHRAEAICGSIAGLAVACGTAMYSPTVSIGLASFTPQSPVSCGRIFEMADAALYRAKNDGRNRVVSAS